MMHALRTAQSKKYSCKINLKQLPERGAHHHIKNFLKSQADKIGKQLRLKRKLKKFLFNVQGNKNTYAAAKN